MITLNRTGTFLEALKKLFMATNYVVSLPKSHKQLSPAALKKENPTSALQLPSREGGGTVLKKKDVYKAPLAQRPTPILRGWLKCRVGWSSALQVLWEKPLGEASADCPSLSSP